MSPVVTAESTATVVDGGPTLDSVMRAHPGLSVTDALEILSRKTSSAADKAVEHHGREGKRIYTEEPTDRKGAVMTAVLSVRPSCCYFLQGICTFGGRCEHAHIKSTRCHFGHRCRVGHAAPLVDFVHFTGGASKGAGKL